MKPSINITSELIGAVEFPRFIKCNERFYITIGDSNIIGCVDLKNWEIYNFSLEISKNIKLEFSNHSSENHEERSLVLYITLDSPEGPIAWHVMKQDGIWCIEERYIDEVCGYELNEGNSITI